MREYSSVDAGLFIETLNLFIPVSEVYRGVELSA
jgi:hypothetical protein